MVVKSHTAKETWQSLFDKHINICDLLDDKRFADVYDFTQEKTEVLLYKCNKMHDFAYLHYKFFSISRLRDIKKEGEISKQLILFRIVAAFNKNLHKLNVLECKNLYELLNSVIEVSKGELLLLRVKRLWLSLTSKEFAELIKEEKSEADFEKLFNICHKDDPQRELIAEKINSFYRF